MTVRKRPADPEITHTFQAFMAERANASKVTAAKDKLSKKLRAWVERAGQVALNDDGTEVTGNIVALLPEPVQIGGRVWAGAELRKQPQVTFDEDAALALADARGIGRDQVGHTEYVTDQEAFYVLQQQGKITEAELDALLVEGDPRYSLWPLESYE